MPKVSMCRILTIDEEINETSQFKIELLKRSTGESKDSIKVFKGTIIKNISIDLYNDLLSLKSKNNGFFEIEYGKSDKNEFYVNGINSRDL